ncbi:hypothetical protein THMIRHAS_13460 [Thiosulfatimonas sediminis]|uniref:SPOR domain-containing protein n=1 Tax=Thiosulfatimonas sediminis TaxID=2675054 RepID=A0A6F8PV10_9GAMM|nr:SPOR domain-containing protein [Thiosulfatimonas sediminis]BBP45973.1 hypothetical protein THMIRHAS_13460 [Thiosulfatimonas sediminis]
MANSPSELDAERARILADIENRAKSMSNDSSATTLQDWLKAAEDVVPQSVLQASQNSQSNRQNTPSFQSTEAIPMSQNNRVSQPADLYRQAFEDKPASNTLAFSDDDFDDDFSQVSLSHSTPLMDTDNVNQKTMRQPEVTPSFSAKEFAPASKSNAAANGANGSKGSMLVGMAIMLSLFITVLVVVVLGYNSMNERLNSLKLETEKNQQLLAAMQQNIENTPLNTEATLLATDENRQKLSALQNQIVVLEAQLATVRNDLKNLQQTQAEQQNISENVLQQKIEQMATVLQSRAQNTVADLEPVIPEVKPFKAAVNIAIEADDQSAEMTKNIGEIRSPSIPKEPEIQIAVVPETNAIVVPDTPKVTTPVIVDVAKKKPTAEVQWLMQQPEKNYTLQLMSMLETDSIQRMINKNKLQDAKIIPQIRDNKTMYVLIVGSFKERKQADELAKNLKQTLGISPWIRHIDAVLDRVK